MALTVDYAVLIDSGERAYPSYDSPELANWSTAYNYSTPINRGVCPADGCIGCTRWVLMPGARARIGRSGVVFDTQALPVGISLQSAKLLFNAKYVSQASAGPTDVMDVLRFVRAPGLTWPATQNQLYTDFGYLRDCGIYLGGILITPGMTTYTACETVLNAAGLASIVPAGYTKFGMRADSDVAASPGLGTCWYCLLKDALLQITYTTDTELLVETYAATDLTTTSATLNGGIIQGSAIKRGFDWGVDADNLINEWYEEGSFAVEDFSHAINGLTPGQGLCHRAKASED